jgi:hypothetical protein
MANEIATAGISVSYCLETVAGTFPSSGTWTNIPNVKGIGEMNPEPATYDATDLSDTVWKRYIQALRDMGGNIPLTVNFNGAFKTAWGNLCSAAHNSTTGLPAGYRTWFKFTVPTISDKFYVAGDPADVGFPAADTDQIWEGTVYVTPLEIKGWAA